MRRMMISLSLLLCLTMVALSQSSILSNRVWVGIGYLYAANGGTAGGGALLGVAGVIDATLQGAAWGAALGAGAGAVAGAAAGL